MPSYRERIFLCPAETGQPGWIMDFPLWWNRSGFFEKFGARRFDTENPFYVDYALLLTVWEANVWDEHCRKAFVQDPRSQVAQVIEAMEQLATRLKATSWVVVESSEWESGLD